MRTRRYPVIFLHGLGRSRLSLSSLRRHVERAGFVTWARTYPSRRMTLSELAATLAEWVHQDLGNGPVLGVSHSLGGILARKMRKMLRWKGLVMIAPPNRGSRLAAVLGHHPLFRWFTGPAGQELGRAERWPAPPEPFAVIAGTRSLSIANPTSWLSTSLGVFGPHQPSDGTVAVEETRLPRMAAFATVDATHTWIMNATETRELVISFLREGRFPSRD